MRNEKSKKPKQPENFVERWEIEWEYERTVYGCYPLHRTLTSAIKEAQKIGVKKDEYGMRLESVLIKRVKVPV